MNMFSVPLSIDQWKMLLYTTIGLLFWNICGYLFSIFLRIVSTLKSDVFPNLYTSLFKGTLDEVPWEMATIFRYGSDQKFVL